MTRDRGAAYPRRMSYRNASERWVADMRPQGGPRVVCPPEFQSEEGAAYLERLGREQLERGEPGWWERQTTPSFRRHWQDWLDTVVKPRCRPATVRARELAGANHILPVLGSLRLADIGARELERYVAAATTHGLSADTIRGHLGMIRGALRTARRWKLLAAVPDMPRVRSEPPEVDWLTEEGAAELLSRCDGVLRAGVAVALFAGLRKGEVLGLRWGDIDRRGRVLHVRRSRGEFGEGPPKGGQPRTVPMVDDLIEILEAAPRHVRSPYLLWSRGHGAGEAWSHMSQWRRLRDAAAGDGEEVAAIACYSGRPLEGRWHVLRHTFASRLVQRGVSLRHVQTLMGHASIRHTERYAHLAPGHLAEAVAVLSSRHRSVTGAQDDATEEGRG